MRLSVPWLVAMNLVPVAGVFLLDWDVSAILFLYWAENLVIGVFNLLKMKQARGQIVLSRYLINNQTPQSITRKSMMTFFIVHYGLFTLVHGIFVAALFGIPFGNIRWLLISLLLLFGSHGISYYYNFLKGEEIDRLSYQDLFVQPYSRVVVMHITIILGGFLVQSAGSPKIALLVMVGLKISIDVGAHLLERKKSVKKVTGLDI